MYIHVPYWKNMKNKIVSNIACSKIGLFIVRSASGSIFNQDFSFSREKTTHAFSTELGSPRRVDGSTDNAVTHDRWARHFASTKEYGRHDAIGINSAARRNFISFHYRLRKVNSIPSAGRRCLVAGSKHDITRLWLWDSRGQSCWISIPWNRRSSGSEEPLCETLTHRARLERYSWSARARWNSVSQTLFRSITVCNGGTFAGGY